MNETGGPAPGPEPLPEPLPEPGPELGPVSVPVAAKALGISERAVRKRIHAGTLRAEPFGRSFMVWLPDEEERVAEPGPEPGPASGPEHQRGPVPGPEPGPEPFEAAYRVTPTEIERAIERTGQKYVADFTGLYDRISAELGKVYEGQLAAKDETIGVQAETIAELRRRAEVAEAARDRLAAAQAAQEGAGATERSPIRESAPAGAWGRLRRWWRG